MNTNMIIAISNATGLLEHLAAIIEQYDGRYDLKKKMIQLTCREHQMIVFDHPYYPPLNRLILNFLPCERFPFCKHTCLNCLECKFASRLIISDIQNPVRFDPYWHDGDLLFDEQSADEVLMWMINGGIAWTIPHMDKDLADHIDHLMSFAYISLCAKITA